MSISEGREPDKSEFLDYRQSALTGMVNQLLLHPRNFTVICWLLWPFLPKAFSGLLRFFCLFCRDSSLISARGGGMMQP